MLYRMAAVTILQSLSLGGDGGLKPQPIVQQWQLVAEMEYESSGALLSRVERIVVGSQDEIYVLDRGQPGVLVFGAAGQYERTIGSEGEGPGEFLRMWNIGVWMDTLWVVDSRLGRVSFFDSRGNLLVTDQVVGHMDLPPGVRMPLVHGALSRHQVFVIAVRGSRGAEEAAFFGASRGRKGVREIGSLELADRWYVIEMPGRGAGTSSDHQPFGFYDQFALSSDGRSLVIVRREKMWRERAKYRVELYQGERDVSIEVGYEPRELTERDIEDWLASYEKRGIVDVWLRNGMFRSVGSFREAARRALALEKTLPPTANDGGGIRDSGIVIGRGGRVFLKRFRAHGDVGSTWDVVEPRRGERIAVLTVPENVDLVAVAGNYAWGVMQDPYDVPSIHRFRITKKGEA